MKAHGCAIIRHHHRNLPSAAYESPGSKIYRMSASRILLELHEILPSCPEVQYADGSPLTHAWEMPTSELANAVDERLDQAVYTIEIEERIAALRMLEPPEEYRAIHAEIERAMYWLEAAVRFRSEGLDHDDVRAIHLAAWCLERYTDHIKAANTAREAAVYRRDA